MVGTYRTGTPLITKLIRLLTAFQFSAIFIFESKSYGVIILAVLSFTIFLLGAYENHGRIRVKLEAYHFFILGFMLFCYASSIWAWEAVFSLEKGNTLLGILVCYSFVYSYYRHNDSVDSLFYAIMWGCYIVMLSSIISFGWDEVLRTIQSEGRLTTGFTNINSLGMIMALAILINVYRIQVEGFRIWDVLMVPTVIMIAASASRKALVLSVVGVALLSLTKESGTRRNLAKKMLRLIAVAAGIYLLIRLIASSALFSGVNNRMQGLFALITGRGEVDHSAWVRQRMIEIGWEQFLKTPILGIGMGNARFMAVAVRHNSYLHNNYIELLANGGIVGFSIYYSIYLYLIVTLLRYRERNDHVSRLCLILIVCFLIMDYGAVTYYSKSTHFFLMAFFIEAMRLKKDGRFRLESASYPLVGRTEKRVW